jgi:hydrogenase maturation protease
MRTLVLGLGNPLLRDDQVGLLVVRELEPRLGGAAGIDVDQDYHGGLRLMERLVGYDRAIVIDAIQSGQPPGTIHRLQVDSRPTQRSASAHDVDLATALSLGRQTGAALPPDEAIHLVAIEAREVLDFGEQLTPAVAEAIPQAVQLVLQILGIDEESA